MRWGHRAPTTRSRSVGSPPSPASSPTPQPPPGSLGDWPVRPSRCFPGTFAVPQNCSAGTVLISVASGHTPPHPPAFVGPATLGQAGQRAQGRAVMGTGRGLLPAPPATVPATEKATCPPESRHLSVAWGPSPHGDLGGVGGLQQVLPRHLLGPILVPLPKSRGFVGAGRTPYTSLQHLRAWAASGSSGPPAPPSPLPYTFSPELSGHAGSARKQQRAAHPPWVRAGRTPQAEAGAPRLCTPLSNCRDRPLTTGSGSCLQGRLPAVLEPRATSPGALPA